MKSIASHTCPSRLSPSPMMQNTRLSEPSSRAAAARPAAMDRPCPSDPVAAGKNGNPSAGFGCPSISLSMARSVMASSTVIGRRSPSFFRLPVPALTPPRTRWGRRVPPTAPAGPPSDSPGRKGRTACARTSTRPRYGPSSMPRSDDPSPPPPSSRRTAGLARLPLRAEIQRIPRCWTSHSFGVEPRLPCRALGIYYQKPRAQTHMGLIENRPVADGHFAVPLSAAEPPLYSKFCPLS